MKVSHKAKAGICLTIMTRFVYSLVIAESLIMGEIVYNRKDMI